MTTAARAVVFDVGGVLEPEPRIYLLTCGRLGVRPGEAVFLDDLEANVVAARKVGLRAVLFRTTAQAIADVQACLEEGLRAEKGPAWLAGFAGVCTSGAEMGSSCIGGPCDGLGAP